MAARGVGPAKGVGPLEGLGPLKGLGRSRGWLRARTRRWPRLLGQLARAARGGGDSLAHKLWKPAVSCHQHLEGRKGGAPWRGDVLAQHIGTEIGSVQELARARDRAAREFLRQLEWEAYLDGGVG